MARQIVKDIREAQPVSWTYWQAIDQGRSGWGFLDMDLNHGKTDYVVNRKYYVFANFSKFLRPGCRFVSIDDASTVAAIKGKQLVLVAVNSGDERPVDFDLSAFRTSPGTVSAFRTSPTENLAPIASSRLVNGILSTTLPAHSVTTFLVPRR
jgi:O-glycosyl hydrolase